MNSSPNESVSGELHVPQDPDVDPPVDLESDDDIPSAQPQPHRPPDPVNVVQRNPRDTPPPETLAEALNDLNSSQDLPLQDADLVRLQEFRTKWFDTFSADSSWQDFSTQCETFADETRSLAQELSRPKLLHTAKPPNNPPPRRPPNGRPIQCFDPVAARRIQGLYRHSKKRAARKLLNNNTVSFSGSVADVETYFHEILDEKHCNVNLLHESLRQHVPSGEDHETTNDLYADVSESEVAAKLRSAANTSPGADRV
jgi:hypothetical protein